MTTAQHGARRTADPEPAPKSVPCPALIVLQAVALCLGAVVAGLAAVTMFPRTSGLAVLATAAVALARLIVRATAHLLRRLRLEARLLRTYRLGNPEPIPPPAAGVTTHAKPQPSLRSKLLDPRFVRACLAAGTMAAVSATFSPWGLDREIAWRPGSIEVGGTSLNATMTTYWSAGALRYSIEIGAQPTPGESTSVVGDLRDYDSSRCTIGLDLGTPQPVHNLATLHRNVTTGTLPMSWARYRWLSLGRTWQLVPDCR